MLSLLITLIAGLFFLVGALITLFAKKDKNLVNFSIGMSFIVLIILVIVDILPECLELISNNTYIWLIGGAGFGFVVLLLLEKLVPHHDHFEEIKHHDNHLSHIGVMTSLALIIHNIIEGIGIQAIASTNLKMGLLYALGVALHNIPFGIEITVMLRDNHNKKKMWTYIILLTLSTFIGGLLVFIISGVLTDFVIGLMLSIAIGMIIYIVFAELFVELRESFNKYSVYGIIIGALLMLIGMVV